MTASVKLLKSYSLQAGTLVEPEPMPIDFSSIIDSPEDVTKSFNGVKTRTNIGLAQDEYIAFTSQKDRRVSLTVVPRLSGDATLGKTLFAKKILSALGEKQIHKKTGTKTLNFNNFLYQQLCTNTATSGLLLPYTPSIDEQYTIGYETTTFTHSNLQIHNYQNSPPPKISLNCKFTADTYDNAMYMLAAIWFLKAVTKSGSIDNSTNGVVSETAGMPPPLLYLNGYDNLIDNTPVLINGFSFKYPDDIDYVNVQPNLIEDVNFMTKKKFEKDILHNGSLSFWLPLEMTIPISLLIQPNITREEKLLNMNDYKSGILKLKSVQNTLFASDDKRTTTDDNKVNYIPTGWSW